MVKILIHLPLQDMLRCFYYQFQQEFHNKFTDTLLTINFYIKFHKHKNINWNVTIKNQVHPQIPQTIYISLKFMSLCEVVMNEESQLFM
jgi:hypothetical protein